MRLKTVNNSPEKENKVTRQKTSNLRRRITQNMFVLVQSSKCSHVIRKLKRCTGDRLTTTSKFTVDSFYGSSEFDRRYFHNPGQQNNDCTIVLGSQP